MSLTEPRSASELRFYLTRAGVGAGASYAEAEFLAQAAERLAAEGVDPSGPSVRALENLAAEHEAGTPVRHESALKVCAAVCDQINLAWGRSQAGQLDAGSVDEPLLLVSAVAAQCAEVPLVELSFHAPGATLVVSVIAGSINPDAFAQLEDLDARQHDSSWQVAIKVLAQNNQQMGRQPDWRGLFSKGIRMETNAWSRIQSLFHKSLVPSNDQSRLAGAGAGLNDND